MSACVYNLLEGNSFIDVTTIGRDFLCIHKTSLGICA